MKAGDRIKIVKRDHPVFGYAAVLLGFDQLDDGASVIFAAASVPHQGKIWPVFVLRPHHVELVAEGDIATSRRLVEEIIDACEARGCPLRGLYSWAGPYKPPKQ